MDSPRFNSLSQRKPQSVESIFLYKFYLKKIIRKNSKNVKMKRLKFKSLTKLNIKKIQIIFLKESLTQNILPKSNKL